MFQTREMVAKRLAKRLNLGFIGFATNCAFDLELSTLKEMQANLRADVATYASDCNFLHWFGTVYIF